MCGIVLTFSTAVGGMSTKNQKVFEDTLFMTSLRGMDSTGVFTYDKNKGDEVMLVKEAYPSPLFLQTKDYEKLESHLFYDCRAVIGHCRAATRGTVKDETAHPYHHGSIILVHNGTLPSHHGIATKTFTVDSEAICHALSERPWEEVLPEIHGAFVLIWYDLIRKVLCIASNGERPFYTATSKSGDLYGASEYGMLSAAIDRNKEDLIKDKDGSCFYAFPKNTVLEIPYDFKGKWTDLDFKPFKEATKSFMQGHPKVTQGNTGNIKQLTHSKKEEKPVTGKKPTGFRNESELTNPPSKVWFEIEKIEDASTKHNTQRIWGRGFLPDNTEYITCTLTRKQVDFKEGDFIEAKPYLAYTQCKDDYISEPGKLHFMVDFKSYLLLGDCEDEVNDLDGNSVTKEEWMQRSDQDRRCSYCNGLLSYFDLQYAVTHRTNSHIDTVICGNCIDASIN